MNSNNQNVPVTSISQVPQTDIASFQKANQNLQFSNSDLAAYNGAVSVPNTTSTNINAETIGQTNPLTVTPTPTDTTHVDFANSLNPIIQNALTPAPTQIEQNTTDLRSRLASQEQALTGYGTDYQTALDQQNYSGQTQELKNVNLQLAQKKAQFDSAIAKAQQSGDTTEYGQGAAALAQRQSAVELGALASYQAALQGNITLSQQLAQQTVDIKYKPIQDQITAIKDNITQNLDAMDAADKKKAIALSTALSLKSTQIDNQKTIDGYALSARNQGAPDSVVQAIVSSKDPQSAIVAAGNYLQTPKFTFTQSYDPKTGMPITVAGNTLTGATRTVGAGSNTAQTSLPSGNNGLTGSIGVANPNASTQNAQPTNSNASYAQYGLLSNTDFNPNTLVDSTAYNYLKQYLSSGSIPVASTIGITSRGGGSIIQYNNATKRASDLYQAATGQPLPSPEVIAAQTKLINDNNKLLNNLNVQEGTIKKNFGLNLENLTTNNINDGYRILNGFMNTFNTGFSDPNTAQYLLQNSTLQTEAGNLLAVKNAQGTTVYDKIVGAGLIPPNASKDEQVRIMKTLLQEASNSSQTIKDVNGGIYQQIDPLEINPNNPNRQQKAITSGFSVQAPDGKTYSFPDQASLDNFKKSAKIQ